MKIFNRRFHRMFLACVLTLPVFAMAEETNKVDKAVVAEEWTWDFAGALAKARAENRPLIIIGVVTTCEKCHRLERVVEGPVFRYWAKGTGLYLARIFTDKGKEDPVVAEAVKFLMDLPAEKLTSVPHIGVYWPRKEGEEVKLRFSYLRGGMPGKRCPAQVGELTSAFDTVLADYFKGQKRPSWDEIAEATKKHVAVATVGEGSVEMTPENGEMMCGKTVKLTAKQAKGWRFINWNGPDGKPMKKKSRFLTLPYEAAEGTYTAVFGKK